MLNKKHLNQEKKKKPHLNEVLMISETITKVSVSFGNLMSEPNLLKLTGFF
jgi:hypothetical protein